MTISHLIKKSTLASILLTLFSGALYAESEPEFNSESYPPWIVEVPANPVKFDWLMVKKGEVLGGDLISMFDDRFEFDSDEVGVHKVKMKDVLQLRTKNIVSVRLVDGRVIDGRLILNGDKFYFAHAPEELYPRESMLTISPSEKSEQSLWDGELSAGFNFKQGNTQSFDYSIGADLRRLSANGRFLVGYTGIYEEVTDVASSTTVTTEDNHRINASYDYYFSKKVYFRLPNFDLVVDEFKNLDYQTTLGIAFGYEVIDIKGLDLSIYGGPSAQLTQYLNVEAGQESQVISPVLALGLDFEIDLTSDIEFFLIYDGKIVNDESGAYIQRMETGFDIELIDDFDLEIFTIVDRTANPIANELGEKPQQTDVVLTIGLEYEF